MTRRRVGTAAFALLLVAIAGVAVQTARAAQEAVLDSQSGSISAVALDPDAPGFRAFTEPTPTALVLHTAVSTEGRAELSGVTLLAGGDDDRGGTVITVPADFAYSDQSDQPLFELFANGGFAAVVDEMKSTLQIGFADVVVLDARSWTQLMAADLPLSLTLREDLIELTSETETRLILAGGTRTFDLAEIELMATHRNPGEDLDQLALRQQAIWRSWVSQTAALDERPELFTVTSGFVNLIGILASGETTYRTIPSSPEAVSELIARIVPFPTSPEPGSRPSVMLLDGTGAALDRAEVLAIVVRAGGRVAILGNDVSRDRPSTEVQVHDPRALEVARRIAQEMGAGTPVEVPLTEATVEITLLIGADQVGGL